MYTILLLLETNNFSYGELEVSYGGTRYPMLTGDSGFFDFKVKLPDGLTCDQCVFQVIRRRFLILSFG
jgi:hypothetical protein